MIDEIFEMVMKEARSRPGDNLNIKALYVLLELHVRVMNACGVDIKSIPDSLSKDYIPA